MTIKSFCNQAWRFIVLVIGLVTFNIVFRILLPRPAVLVSAQAGMDPAKALLSLTFTSALITLLMQYLSNHSKSGGVRLFVALSALHAGMGSFMLQLETVVFHDAFPSLSNADPLIIMLDGVVIGIAFSALVVTVTGQWGKRDNTVSTFTSYFVNSWRILVFGALLYPVVYFAFGKFIAYGNSTVVAFYSASKISTIILISIQIIRGALWVLLSMPVVSILNRNEDICVALVGGMPLFSAMSLIMENPIMPEAVRYAHGFELSTSMCLFGILISLSFSKVNSKMNMSNNEVTAPIVQA